MSVNVTTRGHFLQAQHLFDCYADANDTKLYVGVDPDDAFFSTTHKVGSNTAITLRSPRKCL